MKPRLFYNTRLMPPTYCVVSVENEVGQINTKALSYIRMQNKSYFITEEGPYNSEDVILLDLQGVPLSYADYFRQFTPNK